MAIVNPAYGDQAKLEQLGTGLKRTGGTHGPVIQKTPAGRPPEGGSPPAPQGSPQVDPAFNDATKQLAQAELAVRRWQALAENSPTPWVQGMLALRERERDSLARQIFGATPYFEP
jgi:hypothetical protein